MARIYFPDTKPLQRTTTADPVAAFGREAALCVRRSIGACPRYAPTEVHRLSGLAHAWGLEEIWVKDERKRLGLNSFKALGGAYAVLTMGQSVVARHGSGNVSIRDLVSDTHPVLAATTFAAATSGNHGCSVAAGARLVGARSVVFAKSGIPPEQIRAISALGAEIVSVPGTYDDAVVACRRACADYGWIAIPDSAIESDDHVVARVMEGYTLIAAELLEQMPRVPSHVVLQAGVGGFAAAVAGHMAAVAGAASPRVIVAEPSVAACLQASALAGRPVSIPQPSNTTMGRLDCYSPSLTAWSVLKTIVSAYATVSDAQADAACEVLAAHDLHTTASGAAGFAALMQLIASPEARLRLEFTPESAVVVFVTEAALAGSETADFSAQ
jgi:diaminopropionate ammonia-lyase